MAGKAETSGWILAFGPPLTDNFLELCRACPLEVRERKEPYISRTIHIDKLLE